ncbi:hypothetical protein M413DRAFT_247117 [Hebeloma cylindrosporum]|uniref:Uncharacterized protein n=1 Tax=Hebeloma cylindrosporum TaxID=76867 RepID=A0A0C2YAY2_HEBCY|nr:hypothetical protein M413DRAFT_247117 [Hebeloma cylindrosporum h7]
MWIVLSQATEQITTTCGRLIQLVPWKLIPKQQDKYHALKDRACVVKDLTAGGKVIKAGTEILIIGEAKSKKGLPQGTKANLF